jgi:two-component system, OmpR family, response regulator
MKSYPPLARVLHVEDDPAIRRVAHLALARVGGLTVESAGSAAEALTCLERFAPQLILMDVMMPEVDGPELLRQLRARPDTATTPVVFMTAKGLSSEHAELQALGAIAVLEKPFDPMTLAATLQHLWAGLS